MATGKILWQTADPSQGLAMGAVTVANGVLYAPSISGNMHALDAASGRFCGPSKVGAQCWTDPRLWMERFSGVGSARNRRGRVENKVYSFGLPPATSR